MSKTVAVAISNTSLLVALIFASARTSFTQSVDSVSGTVVDIAGKELAGVQVTAQPDGAAGADRTPIVTQADKSGRYRFEGLPAGDYVISAKRLGENGTSVRATFSSGQAFDTTDTTFIIAVISAEATAGVVRSPVVLPHHIGPARVSLQGGDSSVVDILLMKSPVKVSGRVTVSPGIDPRPSLRVSIKGALSGVSGDVEVLANGTFEFPCVPPDSYVLRLLPNLGIPMTTIIVSDRDLAEIELGSESTGVRVRGRVPPSDSPLFQDKLPQWVYLAEEGQRLSNIRTTIGLSSQNNSSTSQIAVDLSARLDVPVTSVGPDGDFELKSNDGEYDFFLSDLPDGCAVKSMSYGGEDLLNKTMKVDATSVPREILAMVECSLEFR